MENFFGQHQQQDDNEWLSVSDLMSVLMMIFMFIAIVYLRPLIQQRAQAEEARAELALTQAQVRQIVTTFQESEQQIYEALRLEFADDLDVWGAEILRENLMVRFNSPEVLFEQNSSELRPIFRGILADFFPRYLEVLSSHRDVIDEVRIEGHTSSEWATGTERTAAFFRNMELSQNRTRSVLEYAVALPAVDDVREWALSNVTANGLSSSKPLVTAEGVELPEASRRVEFSVRTNATDQVREVLETLQ